MEKEITLVESKLRDPLGRVFAFTTISPSKPTKQLYLCHGFSEHRKRYYRFARALAKQGILCHLMDLVGHGESGGTRSHVDSFQDYVDDFYWFWLNAPHRRRDLPTFIFGHSMGGLITSHFCLQAEPAIRGLILTSPLAGFHSWKGIPLRLLARYLYSQQKDLLFPAPFRVSVLCRDKEKYSDYLADPLRLHTITPALYLGMGEYCHRLFYNAHLLSVPTLIFASRRDRVVSFEAIRQYHHALSDGDHQLVVFRDGEHELIQEQEYRQIQRTVTQWIADHEKE